MTRSRACRHSILLALAVSIASPARLAAQAALPRAAPEDVGLSSERLQRLTRVLDGYIERGEVVGTVMLVARRGRVVHLEARGLRDREAGAPMTTDTIFRMASMTKPITSVALMSLWEEGRLQLRDPVSKWIPEYADLRVFDGGTAEGTVPLQRPVTVQQLLTHTAGLANRYRGPNREAVRRLLSPRPRTLEESVLRIATLPLGFQPGAEWQYGTATDTVGLLVERISGMTLDAFFRERLFEPLKMTDTHFYLPREKLGRFAAAYGPDESGKAALIEAPDGESAFVREPHTFFSGAGGLVSTAADYFRFQQMMLNGGELDGVRILGPRTVRLMTVNHTGDLPIWNTGPGHGFGLGYAIITDIGPSGTPFSLGTYYWGGAYGTTFWVDPAEELIGMLLIQLLPYDHVNIRYDVRNAIYSAILD